MRKGRPRLRRALPLSLTAAVLALVGCGPIPVAQAERQCLDTAQAATGPRGSVSLGVASDGRSVRPVSGIELSISSDALAGRDPADVFNRCVMRRSGQMPTRPLSAQPGWGG